MINTDNLKKSTCKITCDSGNGTGVIVSADMILTCLHVVENIDGQPITVTTFSGNEITATVKDICEKNDLAILSVQNCVLTDPVNLCNEVPMLGVEWATHGHPMNEEGLSVGSKLDGTIKDNIIKDDHQHDVVLDSGSTPITAVCKGYSGSGVINNRDQVTSIMRYKDTNAFCSVSIRKAATFLIKNGVPIHEDRLDDFNKFKGDAFQTIANPLKDICTSQLPAVINVTSPQVITETLLGELFYPKSDGDLSDIIAEIKKTKDLNTDLWNGWLEMLAYLQMVKGNYQNANDINILLKDVEISELIEGIETKIKQDVTLQLQFFLAKEKEYFTIARKYLLLKKEEGTLKNWGCHVFHSQLPRFGQQAFTREEKKKVVFDISDAEDAGLQVVGDTHFGVLSFNELSAKIAPSQNKTQAVQNIKQVFIDAIS